MEKLIVMALQQGLGYGLFVFLLIYILKKQEDRDKFSDMREERYQEIIGELTASLNIVEDVKKDVEDIKDYLGR